METIDRNFRQALLNISAAINKDERLRLINDGGCGVFAAIVMKQFDLPSDWLQWIYARSIKRQFEANEVAAVYHVLIKIDDELSYDSNGFHNPKYSSYPITEINYSYLAKTLREISNWNSDFDRKRLTPIIRDIVKTEAEKYYATI